jgi:CheY-like chemotaxis protein
MSVRRKKILFVDDDVDLLELVKQLMSRFAGEAWEVLTASDVSKAMVLLQQRRIDLLVLDIRMPLVDGLQFLGLLRRKYPNMMKVVLTGEATDEHRVACLSSGAELFLEKPRDEGGWRAVYAMLNELAKLQPEEGFRGVLRRVGLQDVLQMECLARNSTVLQVRAGEHNGTIYVNQGQIVHAEIGGEVGEAAFNKVLALPGGEFELRTWAEPSQKTITGSWEFLLMEAARSRDETTQPPGPTGGTETPFLQREDTSLTQDSPTVVPVLDGLPPGADIDGAESAVLAGDRTETSHRPQVEEVLICSLQGEVLHEWQCPNTTGRVSFLEFISQKARQLAQRLPVGAFDRLEANATESRMIAQIQPERALYLRVSRVPVNPESAPVKP